MEETKLEYSFLTFNKVGDTQQGTYKGFDTIKIQIGISKILFKLEKDGIIYYLPTEFNLNQKLRNNSENSNMKIIYSKNQFSEMIGFTKVFEIII